VLLSGLAAVDQAAHPRGTAQEQSIGEVSDHDISGMHPIKEVAQPLESGPEIAESLGRQAGGT